MLLSLSAILLISAISALPVNDNDLIAMLDYVDFNNNIDEDGYTIDISDLGPQAYGFPKNDSGDAVTQWTEASLENPEEVSGYLQGDILIPTQARNGVKGKTWRWKNGIIPYQIDSGFSSEQRDTIRKAIADYHRLTCLRFVPHSGQTDYLVIKSAQSGCWSSVGRIGGRQEVNLQAPGCVSKKGTVLHELLHAVGFMHEQSRPERDDFVTIQYGNIKPGTEINFKKSEKKNTDDFGVGYDYNSVMHYSEFAFSRNSQRTIEPKVQNAKIGQREGLSRGDVKKVNNMYNCKKEEPQSGWLGSIWQNLFGDKRTAYTD
ncbi:zinc metalloproteinase nas-13-like [Zerene cesonia]|uniref:zinc metalloproteinase nas-13-like n=1 Tax=Zerene cesonia TaxID=33412 RepID=UPI0018E53952|nr:zinc metalloproteinase nas-13-like [Zerene cesonia]